MPCTSPPFRCRSLHGRRRPSCSVPVAAGRPVRSLPVGGTARARPRADLRDVAERPPIARQTVPALPAGCWQTTLLPSHWSLVQTFPSSAQAVPLAFLASAGQLADVPVQALGDVALPARGPTDSRCRREAVGRAGRAGPSAGLRHVAGAGRRAADGAGVADRVLAGDGACRRTGPACRGCRRPCRRCRSPSWRRPGSSPTSRCRSPRRRTRRPPPGRPWSTARSRRIGQVRAVPLHVSATSQAPAAARQTVPLESAVQVPRWPARLQAPQVPVQALSQQTPLTQKPEAHWLFGRAPEARTRRRRDTRRSGQCVVDESPPATSTDVAAQQAPPAAPAAAPASTASPSRSTSR